MSGTASAPIIWRRPTPQPACGRTMIFSTRASHLPTARSSTRSSVRISRTPPQILPTTDRSRPRLPDVRVWSRTNRARSAWRYAQAFSGKIRGGCLFRRRENARHQHARAWRPCRRGAMGPERTGRLRCASIAAALVLGAGLSGCGKHKAEPTGTVLVSMADNSFSPAIVHVPVGGSIVFMNVGRNDHNVLAIDKSWSSEKSFGNVKLRPGDMTEIVLSKAGVYPFYCSFHATPDAKVGMVGVAIVGDVQYTPPSGARGILSTVEKPTGVTRRVPQDYPTIQNGVDAADPGDLVLIDKGEYNEAVFVTTPSLTLRGVDRNAVILDGKFDLGTGIMVGANGVAVENMTARNYTLNGFFWTAVKGFRGSYLTAYNNGDYGIYAFGSTDGLFEHSLASGSPDSAFYVGQCAPCRVVLNDVIGNYSGLGYSGTNSSGDMYVLNSRFDHNRSGISTTTFDIELYPPGRDTTIVGNRVSDSGLDNEAAGFYATETLTGNGIALVGTHNNHVERNLVIRSRNNGIVVLPIVDRHYWPATGH